jgi:hypothetical protein
VGVPPAFDKLNFGVKFTPAAARFFERAAVEVFPRGEIRRQSAEKLKNVL